MRPSRRQFLLWSALSTVACTTEKKKPEADVAPAEPAAAQKARLVSLSPAITETIVDLGAGDALVGISDYCRHVERPRVGSAITPNLEAIASLQPTLIISTQVAGSQLTDLGRLGSTLDLPWLSLEEVVSSTRKLGEAIGHRTQGDALAERLSSELERQAPSEAPRVLLLIGSGDQLGSQLWYIRPESLHGKVLEAAGYRNAAPAGREGPPNLSFEGVLKLQPDAVVVLRNEKKDAAVEARILQELKKLTPLQAVKNELVGILSREGSLGVGPRILELPPELKTKLDGLFSDSQDVSKK